MSCQNLLKKILAHDETVFCVHYMTPSSLCILYFFCGSCLFAVSWMPVSLNGKASWGSTGRRSLMSWSFGSAQAPLAMAMSTWVWTVVWWSHHSLTESTSLSHRSVTTAMAAWTGFLFIASLSLCLHSTTPPPPPPPPPLSLVHSLYCSLSLDLSVSVSSLCLLLSLFLFLCLILTVAQLPALSVFLCVSLLLSLSQSQYVLSHSLFCLSAFLFFPLSVFLC